MPQKHKSNRQAPRIPQSSRHKRLRTPSRTGRPHEYLKAPGTNASAAQVEPAGHTNTLKSQVQMPPHSKSSRQATRIPQSSRHKCLNTSRRNGRPYEYLKVPVSYASTSLAEKAGPTNTSKLQAQMPPQLKSNRQAIRIPKSSCLLCLYVPCREGRPHEYLKVPGTNASTPQVEPAGHTNTSKFQAQMPQHLTSKRQAIRIP